jgi:hypothetical protein
MANDSPWLLLSLQLAAGPAYPRVKLWRRLREAGAVSIHGGVHALPNSPDHLALFDRLADETRKGGGQALVFAASTSETCHADLRACFDDARAAEMAEWVRDADALLSRQPSSAEISRMRRRLERLETIDFFGTCPRDGARAKLGKMTAAASRHPDVSAHGSGTSFRAPQLHGRVWVTRRNLGVDRIASAWLIGGFIDPRPRFRFVDPHRYVHQPRELRFDMADGEFTHEEDRCSFETLIVRGGIAPDPGIVAVGEVIHQLDVDDGKFNRPEAAELAAALDAICRDAQNDLDRVRLASPLLDALHARLATGHVPLPAG